MASPTQDYDPAEDPSPAELIAARPNLSMHAMDGLTFDGVPLNAIADAVGTPTYVYSADTLRHRYRNLAGALKDAGLDAHVHYAVKANDHLAVLSVLAREGAGADIVSGGELRRALKAGIPADKIVYSGVGKSLDELRLAIGAGVGQINAESAEELEIISAVAVSLNREARVALRVNPDVAAGGHDKISTGRATDKFGIAYDDAAGLYARAASLPGVRAVGIAVHIGSQILDLAPYRAAFERVGDLVRGLRANGHRVDAVDCGGGLGIPYRNDPAPNPAGLAGAIKASFHNMDVRVALEPGRWIVGPAGLLLASVVLSKQAPGMRFAVLDAAMNDLVRPSMYGSWHGIVPVSATDAVAPLGPVDVVGPICETGDTFARGRLLPPLAPGARVALLDAGAYGRTMASAYNARPRAAEVLVDGDRWSVVTPRQTHEDLWAQEAIPT